jgi:hypothetical protein
LQTSRTYREFGVLGIREKILVRQKDAIHCAFKHDDLKILVGFYRGDDIAELRNSLRAKYIQRWNIEADAQYAGTASSRDSAVGFLCPLSMAPASLASLSITARRFGSCYRTMVSEPSRREGIARYQRAINKPRYVC